MVADLMIYNFKIAHGLFNLCAFDRFYCCPEKFTFSLFL